MNQRMRLSLAALLFTVFTAKAQSRPVAQNSDYFWLPGFHMILSNNFITGTHKYSPAYISLPKEEYFTVYGKHLILNLFKTDSFVNPGHSFGGLITDTSREDKIALPFGELQARVSRNDALLRDWQYITSMPLFKDSFVTHNGSRLRPYCLVNDSLEVGDSLVIELRKNGQAPFLRLHLKRENAYLEPFLMAYAHDTSHSELEFIRDQLRDGITNTSFYDDWPPSFGRGLVNAQYMAKSRLAFYFRKDDAARDDSIFLYRVLGGQYTDTSWQKTDGLVLVSSLRSNAHYRLEVKYADGHGQVSTSTFYTPPLWYQTIWFRVCVFGLATAVLVLAFFVSWISKNKRKTKYLQLEMQALYAQMNPHFLFNALGSIQGLINDGQTAKANRYLTGFSKLLRSSISQGRKELVPLSIELKTLDNYIELERLRFDFRYELEVMPSLQAADIEVPPLLAQPLVENAVKHGLSAKRDEGTLRIQVAKENTDLLFLIIDDGAGFDPGSAFGGQGIRLTRDRITLFNRMYKHRKIALDIRSDGDGTCCRIRFKNWISYD